MSEFYYHVYGQRLKSDIPLPELKLAPPGPVRWTFRVVDELSDRPDLTLAGEEHIYGNVSARLYRDAMGHRITVDDTGSYDLLHGSSEIHWKPNDDPWWDFGRMHLLGRVLATALQLTDVVTLHGSGVELDAGVVGFLAPKNAGKSTIAMQLYRAGARFVTDDALPVVIEEPVQALPGIHALRVRPHDLHSGVLAGFEASNAPGRDGKIFLPPFPDHSTLQQAAPLAALYLLHPKPRVVGGAAVVRRPVPPMLASIQLLGQCKVAAMLGSSFAPQLLHAVTSIARQVPVFELHVMRDAMRLPEVIDTLIEWHGLESLSAVDVDA